MQTLSSFILSVLFLSFNAQAAVWEDTQSWSLQYEEQFSEWMKSPNVRETMFTETSSPFYGINPDCADASYALRAVFAYQHKLPFVMTAPSGSRDGKTLNNRMNKWDKAGPTSESRLVAMITEIGDSVGTENLAYFDTFPTAIKSIAPGTLFMYKVKARFKKFIRHTYNIKKVNEVGTFDVIYSTQANKKAHGPLLRRKEKEFEELPNSPWGFKKFRWPEHLGADLSAIPSELGPSMEQFELAEKLGAHEFFKYVKKSVATIIETRGGRVNRQFTALCNESVARIDYVNQALDYLKKTGNRCMDYEEFDAYSTPQRDSGIKDLFAKLNEAYVEAERAGELSAADPKIVAFTQLIFKGKGATIEELKAFCPINYAAGKTLDLATLYKRIEKEQLSSHPNDVVELRWGEATSPKTKCKRWY